MSIKPYELRNGNCKELIKQLADNTIDAIVTDPPYELGFMGKKWDATGIAYDAELWAECLRVLKPGGHLLAFSGSRTYHRMAVAIEDAGFDIRDQIMWVYGSGFPKSHDVSKAIDKMDAKDEQKQRQYKFTAWVRSQNVTAKQIDEATGTFMGSHYTTHPTQPAVMTREHLEQCRHLFTEVPEWVEHEADKRSVESKNFAEREILEQKEMIDTKKARAGFSGATHSPNYAGEKRLVNITAPATDAAKEWNGWGTALKPAHEPICVARKPLIGTVAENVLQYGTGAFNIDGCRVYGTTETNQFDIARTGYKKGIDHISKATANERGEINSNIGIYGYKAREHSKLEHVNLGRWPANLIHDGSAEVLAGFPETKGQVGMRETQGGHRFIAGDTESVQKFDQGTIDSGSAARFFYCAKASKRDRDEGCGELELKQTHRYGAGIGEGLDPNAPTINRNHHPTVKPTELMRYLCRLVTPSNGLIMDPFTGSGSTGKAAILEGFRFLGFEMEPQYIEIATARIEYAIEQKSKQKTEQENTLFGAENE